MRVAVLLGGNSPERDVSLSSGRNIAEALRKNGHDVLEFDPGLPGKKLMSDFNIDFGLPVENENSLYINLLLLKLLRVDLVFNGLHGGSGENGIVQTLLDTLGLKYTGPGSNACMLAMDKEISKMLLLQNGLPTAKFVTIRNKNERLQSLSGLNFPVMVKPADGGSSLGNTVLQDISQLDKAVDFAFKYGTKVLIEEFISGKEIAAGILDGVALPLVHIKPKHDLYDYECKYTPGMSTYTCPAELDEVITAKIQDYALKMYHILGCTSYSRVDFLLRDDQDMFILEANTLPGMTSTSLIPKAAKVVGYSFEELIEKIVQDVLR
jgi:D-alanine-D-alanine ligase